MRRCPECGAGYEGAIDRCPLDRAALVDLADPLLGRLVRGAYRLVSCIGEGSIATVYRARHELAGRAVAVKVLRPAMARSPVLRERFLREALAANRVKHPNVIDVIDCGEADDGVVFLAMDLVEGETLAELVARGPISVALATGIVARLADALAAAHSLGVVHRDLKPTNVVVEAVAGRAPRPRLLDFGLAAVRGERSLTATGDLLGTPSYMAPEQVAGDATTPAVDVYALGCVLTELVTGAPPFAGTTPAVLDAHLSAAPPTLASRRADVDPRIDALAARMLAKDPAARPTADEVARALAPIAWSTVERAHRRGGAGLERLDHLPALRDAIDRVERARAAVEACAARADRDAVADPARTAAERSLDEALDAFVDAATGVVGAIAAWRSGR